MKKQQFKAISYTPLSKEDRFIAAINAIESFLVQYRSEFKFKLATKTTNSFIKFKEEVNGSGVMIISNEGNEKTIYNFPHFNTIARLWHDTIHLNYDLNFSYDDEVKVAYVQMEEIEVYLNKFSYNPCTIQDVKEILYHDIIGQSNYYKETKKFVLDQKIFVYDRFLSVGGI